MNAGDLVVRHELATDITVGNEGKIIVKLGQLCFKGGPAFITGTIFQHITQISDFSLTLHHLDPHSDFVNTVEDGFQLRRLIDHKLRRRHLATIMQPGGHMNSFPVVGGQMKIRVWAGCRTVRRSGQHFRQFGNPLAMPAGIGGLRINRAGNKLEETFKQLFLCGNQLTGFNRDCSRTG